MQKITLLLLTSILTLSAFAQKRKINQSTPRNTVEEVFRCARTGDFSQIHLLCDPEGKGDGDTKTLCSMKKQSRAKKNEFRNYFRLAYSLDEKIIGEGAKVNFRFGLKTELLETMNLIKRNGNWYLASF